MIYQTMLGPVQLDVLCETEDPPPYVRSLLCPPNEILIQTLRLKTHEETEDTTLSVPENAVVKRPGALQHGGEVDPEDEDEDGPEGKRPRSSKSQVAGADQLQWKSWKSDLCLATTNRRCKLAF